MKRSASPPAGAADNQNQNAEGGLSQQLSQHLAGGYQHLSATASIAQSQELAASLLPMRRRTASPPNTYGISNKRWTDKKGYGRGHKMPRVRHRSDNILPVGLSEPLRPEAMGLVA